MTNEEFQTAMLERMEGLTSAVTQLTEGVTQMVVRMERIENRMSKLEDNMGGLMTLHRHHMQQVNKLFNSLRHTTQALVERQDASDERMAAIEYRLDVLES